MRYGVKTSRLEINSSGRMGSLARRFSTIMNTAAKKTKALISGPRYCQASPLVPWSKQSKQVSTVPTSAKAPKKSIRERLEPALLSASEPSALSGVLCSGSFQSTRASPQRAIGHWATKHLVQQSQQSAREALKEHHNIPSPTDTACQPASSWASNGSRRSGCEVDICPVLCNIFERKQVYRGQFFCTIAGTLVVTVDWPTYR